MANNIKTDTNVLRDCAAKIERINARIRSVDKQMDSLYWQLGVKDFWSLLQADLLTKHESKLENCAAYLRSTAEDLETTDRMLCLADGMSSLKKSSSKSLLERLFEFAIQLNAGVKWAPLLEIVSQFGVYGGIVATVGSVGQKDSISVGEGLLSLLGDGAKLIGKMQGKKATINPFGFGETVDAIGFAENVAAKLDGYIINSSYNANNLSMAQKTANNVSAYAKWGGVALNAIGNFFSNADEFRYDMSNPRLYAEAVGETAVSITSGILVGAAVAALAGATAPVWAVGVVSAGVTVVMDWGVKSITGAFGEEKGLAEFVSDTVIDSAIAVGKVADSIGKAVGDGINKVGEAVTSWFSQSLPFSSGW